MSDSALECRTVEHAIASVAARCLRTAFDPDVPFTALGMDSLGTIEMAAALESTLGRRLPPELLLDCRDGRMLAARLQQLRGDGPADGDAWTQMLADAVLPADVRPPRRRAFATDLRDARRILLTGATGFLGGALVQELFDSTHAELLCLVRDPSSAALPRHLPRVHPFTGDLSEPRLGLGDAEFRELADTVDAVLHCGASVNWIYPYDVLRGANVLGTLELLRLACRRGIPFHFVSSLSVLYADGGPATADERSEPMRHIRGIRLGYAQTKLVAESLVREAARRGLPARIYRPALISGDSRTGRYNRDDLITALVCGCVRMGTAPDLDWRLDCLPVDFVARAIVALSREHGRTFHLGHARARHWRECVLWMRMYGYAIRLVPYHTWLRQLERDTSSSAIGSHPLAPLRSFFLDRRAGARGLTLPELYEEGRRTRAVSSYTAGRLAAQELPCPQLDATLLDTYFRALRDRGDLPAPSSERAGSTKRATDDFTPELLGALLGRRIADVRITGTGSDHSIVSELTAWRSRRPSGLFRALVRFDDGSERPVRLKAKAEDVDVVAVGEALAASIDPALGDAYARWSGRLGFAASHRREIEIYRQTDPRFTRHAPALLGALCDDGTARWVLALEDVQDAVLIDAADDTAAWTDTHIETAIAGLSSLHAIWFARDAELRAAPWIGYVPSAAGMAEMTDLWEALARHAAPWFSSWAHPDITGIQRRLVAALPQWWAGMEASPRTLIHNDFNPRNVCLRAGSRRPSLCAYDWELAAVGAPQRDLAELLCFVLPPDADARRIASLIDLHRRRLAHLTGAPVDASVWKAGFRGALYDLLVNRLSIYMVVHRIRPQRFLPRVVRTWRRLYELFPLEERG